jgi:hypothetical protein
MVPLPSPDRFSPHRTLDPASISHAGTREHSTVGDNEGDQNLGDDSGYLGGGIEYLPGLLHASDEGLANDADPGTSDLSGLFFKRAI